MYLNPHFKFSRVINEKAVGSSRDMGCIEKLCASCCRSQGRGEDMTNVLEIAGAALWDEPLPHVSSSGEVTETTRNTIIYIDGFPNSLGDGDVASNFRYKKNTEENNNGCEKWMKLFEGIKYSEVSDGIYVSALPRDGRLRSYKMNEDGSFVVYDNKKNVLRDEVQLFNRFLSHSGIDGEKMKLLREASAGAKYYTYLADMLSLIMIVESHQETTPFTPKDLVPVIVKAGDKRLQPVEKNGRIWTPIEGNDYLYFEEVTSENQEMKVKFYFYRESSYAPLYQKLLQAISLEENTVKSDIRRFFCNLNAFDRWSDYGINDVDDILTIYMVINAFSHTNLTEQEGSIKAQFDHIAESFFQ